MFDDDFYVVMHCETFRDGTPRGIVDGEYKRQEEAEEMAKRMAFFLNKQVRIYHRDEVCEVYPSGRTVWWTR